MKTTTEARTSISATAASCVFLGSYYLITALWMIITPRGFTTAFGYEYNRHFLGDTAAFAFTFGLSLLYAAQRPRERRILIDACLVAAVLHLINHLIDGGLATYLRTDVFLAVVTAINAYASWTTHKSA